jgi:hypothetical protein
MTEIKIYGATSPLFHCAVCLRTYCRKADGQLKQVGYATGFFYRVKGVLFLVTNWHVVTGRNPENPSNLLPGYPASPDAYAFDIASIDNPTHFLLGEERDLYKDGKPIWIEPELDLLVDVVAIPLNLPEKAVLRAIQDFCEPSKSPLEIGIDVIIAGFTFERSTDNPAPIWKKGMVASEPSLLINGKPQIYLDTPGRSGMSGSPVFASNPGFRVSSEQKKLLDNRSISALMDTLTLKQFEHQVACLEFSGIYAGAYGDGDLAQLNLGRMFTGAFIELMLDEGKFRKGTNPFPPA